MDREAVEKPFGRLSELLRRLQKAFVAEIGVDDQGLVVDVRVGELLGALAGLIQASDRMQEKVDELGWGDARAYRAFERAEAKAAGVK